MAFITILKKIHIQRRKYQRSTIQRLYSCGQFFSYRHFDVDWGSFNKSPNIKIHTPLLKIAIGTVKIPYAPNPSSAEKMVRRNPKIGFLTMNSKLSKRAHSNVLINKNREWIFRLLHELPFEFKNNNLISLYFEQCSVFASRQEMANQIKQTLCKYMNMAPPPTEQAGIGSNSYLPFLSPFYLDKWRSYAYAKKQFDSLKLSTPSSSPQSFSIYLCHHYKIGSSIRVKDLYADMHDFHLMIRKFNFFSVIPKMQFDSEKRSHARCRKLIKALKWRTLETEQYLVFLLNQFGSGQMKECLAIFQSAYQHYSLPPPPNSKTVNR